MRTTISIDDDVAAEIGRLRRERGLGISEAVNLLARTGMRTKPGRRAFRQRTAQLGLRVDVSNIGDVLETLDGPTGR